MPRSPSQRRPRSAGYSLVEVVASVALMAATLVPAMELVRDSMDQSVETDRRQLLALYAVSQIEQQLAAAAMTWTTGAYSGDYAGDGHPDIRFDTICSDDPLSGGVSGALMDVRTTVYFDDNSDDALTAGELQCSYRTKIGQFATYQAISP